MNNLTWGAMFLIWVAMGLTIALLGEGKMTIDGRIIALLICGFVITYLSVNSDSSSERKITKQIGGKTNGK